MEKLNVTVGFVFTQVMFCDSHGKLQFHRVLTDVDKPWESVKEVLGLVKEALSMDQPKVVRGLMAAIQVHLEYKKVNFQHYLVRLRDELAVAFSNCLIYIENLYEDEELIADQEEVEEIVAMECESAEFAEDAEGFHAEIQPNLFVFYSSDSMEAEATSPCKDDRAHFELVQQQKYSYIRDYDQRGSPILPC